MTENIIDYEKLDELRKAGWSWRSSVSDGSAVSTEVLLDPSTGKKYKLHVNNGKLTMTEVTS